VKFTNNQFTIKNQFPNLSEIEDVQKERNGLENVTFQTYVCTLMGAMRE
jgi:hypothetical protein